MVVTGFNFDLESPVAPTRFFKAYALDSHNVVPKVLPQVVKSGKLIEGDGGVGSIRHFTFTEVIPYTEMKERVNVLDKDNLDYKYAVIEGGNVGTKLVSSFYRTKFEPSSNGGCIIKACGEYETVNGVEFTEEDMNVGKNGIMGLFKVLEGYLLANQELYA